MDLDLNRDWEKLVLTFWNFTLLNFPRKCIRLVFCDKNKLTIKKIIINACAEMITLNSWWSPDKNCTPGEDNSKRIITENAVPIIPEKTANTRYKVPISLALVELNQFIKLLYFC